MQTDTWLTDTLYPERCPLCSQPLASNSNTCPSCGFTAHEPALPSVSIDQQPVSRRSFKQPNPITPIPARASALRAQQNPSENPSQRGMSQTSDPSSTDVPERHDGSWKYHSTGYEVESSLSSLSLIISETPTAPPRAPQRLQRRTDDLQQVDEVDTVPYPDQALAQVAPADFTEMQDAPGSVSLRFDDLNVSNVALVVSEPASPEPLSRIDEIDTVPERKETTSRALVPVGSERRDLAVDGASWIASSSPAVTTSEAERFLMDRPRGGKRHHPHNFRLFDRLRWWLLRPGHIEFLLWLVGSILLFGITFLLLLATVLSVMLPDLQSKGNLPNSAIASTASVATNSVTPNAARQLTLLGNSQLPPGAEFQLRGQGFQPHSQVTFLMDGRWPLLDQNHQPASIQADASGSFIVNLWLGDGPVWSAGSHQILARQAGTSYQATVLITITDASPTAVSNNPGPNNPTSQPTPPAPPQPTPGHPTPTPVQPTPTPVPSATATPVPSPTVARTPGTPTSTTPSTGAGKDSDSSKLSSSLNNDGNHSLFGRLAHLNPLIWVIVACYILSMVLLGLAGLLRYRRPWPANRA